MSTGSSGGGGDVCPLDNRRSGTSVVWSLLLTGAVCVAAWLRLHHTYGGIRSFKWLTPYLLVALYVPSFPLWSLTWAILAAAVSASKRKNIVLKIKSEGDTVVATQHTNTRDFTYLTWRIANAPGTCGHAEKDNVDGDREVEVTRSERSLNHVQIGHVIVLALSAIQTVGSTIRGIRRMAHTGSGGGNTMTLLDYQVFWFSISGAALVLQLAWLELVNMVVPADPTAEEDRSSAMMGLWLFALALPGMLISTFSSSLDPTFAKTLFSSEANIMIEGSTLGGVLLIIFFLVAISGSILDELNSDATSQTTATNTSMSLSNTSAGASPTTATEAEADSDELFPKTAYEVLVVPLTSFTTINVFVALLALPMLLFTSFTDNFGKAAVAWPVDKPCPQLWQDPLWIPAV